MTPTGEVTQFPTKGPPTGIAAGPDGNIWVTETSRHALLRITPDGTMTEFRLGLADAPTWIVTASDGNLWFLDGSSIVRRTSDGTLTAFPLPAYGFELVSGPDGNLWTGVSSTSSIGRITVAQPGVRHVLVLDAGLASPPPSLPVGGAVQWDFYGSGPAEVADGSGLGLFDSGLEHIASFFPFSFADAGVYPYSEQNGLRPAALASKVTVAPSVTPTAGATTTSFAVTWATEAPSGTRVFDVRVRRPGSSAFVPWLTATTATGASFTPDAGAGVYTFEARMRDTATGARAGYAGRSISVS